MLRSHRLSHFQPLLEMPQEFGRGGVPVDAAASPPKSNGNLSPDFYDALSENARAVVRVATESIVRRRQMRHEMRYAWLFDAFDLLAVREALPDGEWGVWLKADARFNERTARNLINAARLLRGHIGPENFSDLPKNSRSVVYLLAQSDTPQSVRDVYLPRVVSGERVPLADVRAAIDALNPAEPKPVQEDQQDGQVAEILSVAAESDNALEPGNASDPCEDALDSPGLGAQPTVTEDARAAALSKFAKARALHDGTDNDGVKANAARGMQLLASRAGLTVEQAAALLDGPELVAPLSADPNDWLRDLMNTPEHRAREEERERKYAARRVVALTEYGSEDAVWAPCERESALEEACRPHLGSRSVIGGEIVTLQDWDGGIWAELASEAQTAIANAYTAPETVRATWEELQYWEKRIEDQCAFSPHVEHPLCVRARVAFLEDRLDKLPASSVSDIKARVSWLQFEMERGFLGSQETERLRLATLSDDITRMGDKMRGQADRIRHLDAELASCGSIKPE